MSSLPGIPLVDWNLSNFAGIEGTGHSGICRSNTARGRKSRSDTASEICRKGSCTRDRCRQWGEVASGSLTVFLAPCSIPCLPLVCLEGL
jgi:hypothetical protein